MNYGVHNNLMFMNANRNMKINTGKRAKSSEKLSSGYRINRAADDAAGLTISEKMRWQIRGLNRGTTNGEEGISWVQTGDGALDEVTALIHRMRELTIQSLNDTNTAADRAACQAEFDSLQSEIDRITKTTQFNTQNIFDEHELPYYQCEGNVEWSQSQLHTIGSNNNDLIIYYREEETGAQQKVEFQVPAGVYTTQELIDEMDDAIIAAGLDKKGIMFEFTEYGTCNLNLEGGEVIDAVGGGLSYLLYDMYTGGGFGALIGTTTFTSEYARLEIKAGENDELTFSIESFDGSPDQTVNLKIPEGRYTRSELIDILNQKLQGTDVTATAYGSGIKLAGKNSIVTGFKGNMFKIDEGLNVYHSVFYDNVKYGTVGNMQAAYFMGGAVKSTSDLSSEYSKFEITSANNQLVIGANGDALKTLTIPEGFYTVDEMITKLNELFAAEKLQLEATVYTSGGYKGLQITSKEKGITSKVEVDKSCSAFDTLFVKRTYNQIVESPKVDRETKPDSLATVTGAKAFTADKLPFTVVQGQNDTFTLKLTGTGTNSYDITLSAKDYQSVDDIITEINAKLVEKGIDTLVEAKKTTSGAVQLIAKTGSGLTGVSVGQKGSNTGYNDIFVKTTVSYVNKIEQDTGNPPKISLDTDFTDQTTFDNTNNKLNISVNGTTQTVTFVVGKTYTKQEILDEINNQLKAGTVTGNNTFTTVRGNGTTDSNHFTNNGTGTTSSPTPSYSGKGSSDVIQGSVGNIANNKPAQITINKELPDSISIDNTSNIFYISINGTKKQLELEKGVYTKTSLVKELQKKIDAAFGTTFGGAEVSLDGNKLVFNARLNNPDGTEAEGKYTEITCNTADSSFLQKIHTTETPAALTTTKKLQDSIVIANGKNTFQFQYTDKNGQSHDVTLNLTAGTYTKENLAAEINKQLKAGGHGVTASLSGGKLKLTTTDSGRNTKVSFNTQNGGTAVESIFGEMITEKPATGTANCDLQDTIVIDNDSNQFNVMVNGSSVSVTLDNGTYNSRADFVNMLNGKLQPHGLKAELDGNRIKYTTEQKGNGASFVVDYASGGSAMKAMYGTSTGQKPGVNAKFENGKLVLTGTGGAGSLKITSSTGSMFLKPTEVINKKEPTTTAGYSSVKKAYIDGANITEPVNITSLNKTLTFTYYDGVENGVPKSNEITITLDEKEYSFDELKTALQTAIDNSAIGRNELTVSVTGSGVRIEAVEAGNTHYLTGFSGGFYDRVLHRIEKKETRQGTVGKDGAQTNDPAYTIGRKDIRNGNTLIRTGFNDTLKLDFHYGNKKDTYTLKLDAGEYTPDELIKALQEKLDEQMAAKGFEAGTIEVGIGGVNSGVSGSNDANALVFKLSTKVKLPEEGEYIIDGVSGNAAFSIFYQTEGELEPAYIGGSKDVSQGVTIKPGENVLSFKVDQGDSYTITLDEKDYTADELIDELNKKLAAVNAPVSAELHDDTVRLVYGMLGEHRIYEVSGSAKQDIFFEEHGETGDRTGVMIQLSSQQDDSMELDKAILNTLYLGINSIAITKPKYADKALVRLDKALERVSEVRSTFGSEQNRLEHAILNNQNTSENTQAAESRLRDTDMADEMVEQSKHNILVQSGNAVMAQAKVSGESVIKLLQM